MTDGRIDEALGHLHKASIILFRSPERGHIDRAFYHIESAIYQLEHPTNEIPKAQATDATSV